MNRGACVVLVGCLAGCGGSAPGLAQLEGQMRELRADHERSSRRIEVLENRVVLAEDTARQARESTRTNVSRDAIHISEDGSARTLPPPPPRASTQSSTQNSADSADDDDDAPSAGDTTPRPVIRAQGRMNAPDANAGITVRDGERIPLAPVPPPPGSRAPASPGVRPSTAPEPTPARGMGPRGEADPPTPATDPGAPLPPAGVSSVRNPQSTLAYESALDLARTRRCAEAIDAFGNFLIRFPDHPYANNAMYWRAECILERGDTRRAIAEFEGLIRRFPSGSKVPDALYKLVVCYRRVGDNASAARAAERLLQEFPSSAPAERLRAERSS